MNTIPKFKIGEIAKYKINNKQLIIVRPNYTCPRHDVRLDIDRAYFFTCDIHCDFIFDGTYSIFIDDSSEGTTNVTEDIIEKIGE